jgi:tetratricopeptide (TPR) repeat protein
MKKFISLTILIALMPLFMWAESAKTLFEIAGDHYQKGEYQQSISLYDSLIHQNLESAAIYYNMGNAYFKLDQVTKAIYFYEKAKKLEPNNEDVTYNLELANTRIADRIETVPTFFLKNWWNILLNTFTEKQWMYLNTSMFIIFLSFVVLFFTTNKTNLRKFYFGFGLFFLSLSILNGFVGYRSYTIKNSHNTAIIFTPTVNIKSAPDEKSSTLFILHQGSKIKLLSESQQWQKVKIANGSEGWLLKSDFMTI